MKSLSRKIFFYGLCLYCGFAIGQTSQPQIVTYYDPDSTRVKEQIQVKSIQNPIREGSYRSYFYSGKLKSEGFYVNNKPAGIWTYYFENGNPKMEGEIRNLSNFGHWVYYHENGRKKMEGKMIEGKRDGPWKFYYETGEQKSEGEFLNGIREGLWSYFYEQGELKAQAFYRNGRGLYKEFYTTGEVKMQGLNVSGKSDSVWRFYFETGGIKAEGPYEKGLREGFWKYYHPNGQLAAQGTFIDGQEQGKWKYYYENGKLSSEGIEIDGKKEGYWKLYYETGELKGDGFYEKGSGKYKEYYESGKLKIDGFQKNGKNDGTWTYYYEEGEIEGKCDFVDGEGTFIGYYSDGSVKMEGKIKDDRKVGKWKLYNRDGTLAGYYNPVYEDNLPVYKVAEAKEAVVPPRIEYEKPEYRYKSRRTGYFTPRVNEYKAIILSGNPAWSGIGFIPFGIEYYIQERLGYELLVTYIRDPFFTSDANVDLNEDYQRGFSLAFRQKFYSDNSNWGMFYFGHQVSYTNINHSANILDSASMSVRDFTIQADENRYEYGIFIGDRIMKNASGGGFTIDLWIGGSIGYRNYQRRFEPSPEKEILFNDLNKDNLSIQFNFGLNFGFAGPRRKSSTISN
ncbi:MAG: membrane-binding protein [Bacteroidota bacterium]